MATKAKAKAKPARKPASIKSLAKKAVPARKPAAKPTRTSRSSSATAEDQFMNYSGKFTVRLPKSLHQALVDRAEKEGVSLNLFVTQALSRTVALPRGKR